MGQVIKPVMYEPLLDMKQTEQGIKLIKEFFQQNLSTELRLRRVTAPLFVLKGLGINDDLNGVERPVSFPIKDLGDAKAEVVHSLAKWKRLSLAEYKIELITPHKNDDMATVKLKNTTLGNYFYADCYLDQYK